MASSQEVPFDLTAFDEPVGQTTNAIRWLQRQVLAASRRLPRQFATRADWEAFRATIRTDLPRVIGLPAFPPLGACVTRARLESMKTTPFPPSFSHRWRPLRHPCLPWCGTRDGRRISGTHRTSALLRGWRGKASSYSSWITRRLAKQPPIPASMVFA